MSLTPKQRLGPYEILGPIGAGGMGEVYRARDTRLDREVAVKILPATVSGNEQVRARFEREAKTISQLNHSNICTLHDVGNEDGVEFLVMEYIEGETLHEVLARGPLPLDQALRYGIQIMNALDAAHRQRVVHRDLKPANVMITAAGVKLLDFGLAKIAGEAAQRQADSDVLSTHTRHLTEEGTILGTVQYMAPEQLEGAEADARTDIFAFGTLFFEMITGQRTFEGKSRVGLMAAIMEHAPPSIASVQPLAPPALDRLITTCLQKNPDDRWQTAHDVELQLRWIEEGGSDVGIPAPVAAKRRGRQRLSWIVAAAGLVAAILFAALWITGRPAPERMARLSIVPAAGTVLQSQAGIAVSPDGSSLAYVAFNDSGEPSIYLRRLDDLEPRAIQGSVGGGGPFWSPDGAHLAFFKDGKLKRVAAAGGSPQTICSAPGSRGGAWGPDGTIVFSSGRASGMGALLTVAARGGSPKELTALDDAGVEFSHRWPAFLPDGKHVLFARQTGEGRVEGDESTIDIVSLETGETTTLFQANSSLQYVEGHILYWREGSLLALPFDPARREATGDPISLVDHVAYSAAEYAAFSASAEGTLVYHSGTPQETQLTWFDRDGGNPEVVGRPQTGMIGMRLSPDGTRVAYGLNGNIWVLDLERGTETRLTFSQNDTRPAWSPDGEWIAFGSTREPSGIYRKRASGVGDAELIFDNQDHDVEFSRPSDRSADGRSLYLVVARGATDLDVARFDLEEGNLEDLIRTPFVDRHPAVSPDGQWLAAASDDTGRQEVYVHQLSGSGTRVQVSAEGGQQPEWSRDGRTLYYIAPGSQLMAVPVEPGGALQVGAPVGMMRIDAYPGSAYKYALAADGSRVLWNAKVGGSSADTPLTVVQQWPAMLRQAP